MERGAKGCRKGGKRERGGTMAQEKRAFGNAPPAKILPFNSQYTWSLGPFNAQKMAVFCSVSFIAVYATFPTVPLGLPVLPLV